MKNRKLQNTFTSFLELLKVKHTNEFSNQYFNEHPHKYNLFGLSKMLSDYGVNNAGIRISDKENDLSNIELPFIAHTGRDFVVVYKTPPQPSLEGITPPLPSPEGEVAVHYIWNGKKITNTVEQFIKAWSGVILLAETNKNSIEPDYKEHRKKELLNLAQKSILVVAAIVILGIAVIHHSLLSNLRLLTLVTLNLSGVYICYLLVLQQMHIHSRYADKICSLFSKSDCNNVLESDAAKLWGIFGWSEIGLGYFSANFILLLFFPQTIYLLALINILTLPYSFWSVWYQKVKARQWCPLCLIVQVLLWSIFITNCIFGYLQFQLFSYSIIQLFFVGSIYAIFALGFNLLIPNLSKGNGVENIKQEINSIKANEEVFKTLLTQQPYYETKESDSIIRFGNHKSLIKLTILTNPFCNPCAKMHKRVEKILKDTDREVCIQYILSSFTPDLDFANKYLIAAYLQKEQSEFEQIIAHWFEKGKPLREAFFRDIQLDLNNPEVELEFQRHAAWREKTQLRATPTILVGGYKLPENYKIEDLRYFTEFDFPTKTQSSQSEF